MAAFGPDPYECIDFLIAHDIATVRGNTDDYMVEGPPVPDSLAERTRQIMDVMEWSRVRLSSTHVGWLAALPFSRTLADTMVCLHAGPESNTQIVDAGSSPPPVTGARIVCAGHLHRPFVATRTDFIWANAGSVSRPTDADPRGAFLIVRRHAGKWSVEIVRFELDLKQIVKRVKATDMPHQQHWCETQIQAAWW